MNTGQGEEFVVPFSSRSRSLALKSQNGTYFAQNDKVFTQLMINSLKLLFGKKELSFDDFF